MTTDSKPRASQPGDSNPVPDAPLEPDRNADGSVAAHEGPSEAATADIEERQDTERAAERRRGRPPEDAPAY